LSTQSFVFTSTFSSDTSDTLQHVLRLKMCIVALKPDPLRRRPCRKGVLLILGFDMKNPWPFAT